MTHEPDKSAPRRLDPKLLEILVCPLTKTSLDYDPERQELISRAAGWRIRSATAFRSCCPKKRASSTGVEHLHRFAFQ